MSISNNQLSVDTLIEDLASRDLRTRQQAHESLMAIGKPATAHLLRAMSDENDRTRWEVVKALDEIADPAAATVLVESLEDEKLEVRWRAAEGLITLERCGLAPLFRALVRRSNSVRLRDGAHHVLSRLAAISDLDLADLVAPVLAALEDVEPTSAVPVAAHTALKDPSQIIN
jgi:HEAT repeat protein